MRGQRRAVYVCEAGYHHYEAPAKVARWEKARLERLDAESKAKVRAHDDYMEGMRLFRERSGLSEAGRRVRALLTQKERGFQDGYDQAIRDMDRALVDAVRQREARETDESR